MTQQWQHGSIAAMIPPSLMPVVPEAPLPLGLSQLDANGKVIMCY